MVSPYVSVLEVKSLLIDVSLIMISSLLHTSFNLHFGTILLFTNDFNNSNLSFGNPPSSNAMYKQLSLYSIVSVSLKILYYLNLNCVAFRYLKNPPPGLVLTSFIRVSVRYLVFDKRSAVSWY